MDKRYVIRALSTNSYLGIDITENGVVHMWVPIESSHNFYTKESAAHYIEFHGSEVTDGNDRGIFNYGPIEIVEVYFPN